MELCSRLQGFKCFKLENQKQRDKFILLVGVQTSTFKPPLPRDSPHLGSRPGMWVLELALGTTTNPASISIVIDLL
jgi:hypothetical protein